MYRAKVESLFNKLYHRFKNLCLWDSFISKIKQAVDKDDPFSIEIECFDKLLMKFKIKLRPEQKQMLQRTIPGASVDDESRALINIQPLMQIERDQRR